PGAAPVHTRALRGKCPGKRAWTPPAERGGQARGRCRSGARSVTPRAKSTWRGRPRQPRIRSQPKSRRPANSRTARSRCLASTTKRRLRRCAIACRSATSSPVSCAPMAISVMHNPSVVSLPTRSRSAFPALASTSAAGTWPSVSIRRLTRSMTALAPSSRTCRARFRLGSVAPTKSRSTTSSSTMPKPGLHRTWIHIARRRRRSSAPSGPGITTSISCVMRMVSSGSAFISVAAGSGTRARPGISKRLAAKAASTSRPRALTRAANWRAGTSQRGGCYAYAGREWVVKRVRRIIGGAVIDTVHNHHNYAWRETHEGRDVWVVRKGATPAFPGQRGFVGGSMGDDAMIIEGVESLKARASLYSTVHFAGRLFGRKEAKRRFTREQMDRWLQDRGVTLIGADLDESPMAYRRLPEVIAQHAGTVKVLRTLRPFAVVMAGTRELEHVPSQLNQGDSLRAKDERVYRH